MLKRRVAKYFALSKQSLSGWGSLSVRNHSKKEKQHYCTRGEAELQELAAR